MKKNIHHYIGIDFGTSNSYFCITPENEYLPTSLNFDNESFVETAVLWSNDDVIAFGSKAIKGWGYAEAGERKDWRLSVQFKPDISVSEQAKKDAAAFLKSTANYLNKNSVLPGGKKLKEIPVRIGVPSKLLEGHKTAMMDILNEAGITKVKLVEEPVGALLYHIIHHDIQANDAGKGILIVDFGGGTCDVAYMLRLEVKQTFGDPILGGRLFDDLFYQWFLTQNPDAENKLRDDGREYFVHWTTCRDMKEYFSNSMRGDKETPVNFNVQGYGTLKNASWDEFINRAENYEPSRAFLNDFNKYGKTYGYLTSGETINLIQRFKDTIQNTIKSNKITVDHIEQVVLTGGSCLWPFVREIVSKILEIDDDKILISANPRAAVGEGLTLLPVIQSRFNEAMDRIRAEREDKCGEIINCVRTDITLFGGEICDDIIKKIFNKAVAPAIDDFVKTGGKFEVLNNMINARILELEPELEKLIESRKPELEAKMSQRVDDMLDEWFRSHEIKWNKFQFNLISENTPGLPDNIMKIPIELDSIGSLIISFIIASWLGGGGTALLLSGPIGWLISFIIAFPVMFYGTRKVTGKIPLPRKIINNKYARGLLDWSIKKAEKKSKRKLLESLNENFNSNQENIGKEITSLIQKQVDSLSAINSIK